QFPREPVSPDERREAHLESHRRFARHRKQLPVTPHGLRPRLDGRAAEGLLDTIVIVNHLKRAEVKFAHVRGGERILPPALAALERFHEASVLFHIVLSGGASPCRPAALLVEAIKNPFSSRREEVKRVLFSSFPNPSSGSGWSWHLVVEVALQPVAVASSGQSLDHSE